MEKSRGFAILFSIVRISIVLILTLYVLGAIMPKSDKDIAALPQNLITASSMNPIAPTGNYGRDLLIRGFLFINPIMPPPQSTQPTISTNAHEAAVQSFFNADKNHIALYLTGMIMISIGFLFGMLAFIPILRFVLWGANWTMIGFEYMVIMLQHDIDHREDE